MKSTQSKLLVGLIAALGVVVLGLALRSPMFGARDAALVSATAGTGAARAGSLLAGVSPDAAGRDSASAPGARGFYAAPVGREFVYELSGRSKAGLEVTVDGEVVEQELENNLAGRMQILVAARRDDEIVTSVAFDEMSIETAAESKRGRDTTLEQAVATPTLVRMRDDGRLLGFRFGPAVPPEARNWIRSQVTAFRFEVDGTGASSWEREEVDATGKARTRYVREVEPADADLHLRKTKVAYSAMQVGGQDVPIEAQPEVDSTTTGTLSTSLAWVQEARVDESLKIAIARLGITTDVAMSGSLRLLEHGWRSADEMPAIDWDEPWSSVAGAEDMDEVGAHGEELLRARLLDGVTLDGLLAEIDVLANAKPRNKEALMDAHRKLAELLRQDPAAAEELAALVRSMNEATTDIVLGAAGAAGTRQAQQLLVGVLGDATLARSMRQSSLDAMFQLTQPISDARAAVESLVKSDEQDTTLRANAMLLLGALGSMDGGSKAERAELVARLVGLEAQARADGRLAHWLNALGNTGDPQVYAAARPYLDAADARLRAAAADALRGLATEEAVGALAHSALSDADASVRRACASILAGRSDEISSTTVRQMLERDTSVQVRRAAVDALARRVATDATARQLLAYVAANDASQELRQRAAAAL